MKRNLSLVGGGVVAALLLLESSAQAHIKMEGAFKSRTPDGLLPGFDDAQKMSPCDGPRSGGPVYTFKPGTTITLSVSESVPHPGYFRVAFDNDGENDFKEPKSIKPVDPKRACPFDADDQCGQSDFCNVYDPNGPRVLWDNLNPNTGGGGTRTWKVTLPDIECENCTIQIIQVMEDTVHGAYCPQGSCANSSKSLEDIYHRCINIKLKKDATNSPGVATGTGNETGIDCSKAPAPATDAGVGAGDAGARDAGVTSDAGSPSGTGGAAGGAAGTQGGAAGGATGGSPSGAAGGTASGAAGGTASGAAGGAASGAAAGGTAAGTVAGGPGGVSGPAGGTTGAGAGLPDAGTGATAGGAPTSADDDDASCSVRFAGSSSSSTGAGLGLMLITGLALARRRRRSR